MGYVSRYSGGELSAAQIIGLPRTMRTAGGPKILVRVA